MVKIRTIIIDSDTHECLFINQEKAGDLGYPEIDVTIVNGRMYEVGYEPDPIPPTKEDLIEARKASYVFKVDPLTCEIARLRDLEQTPETKEEINRLLCQREKNVKEIKDKFKY